MMATQKRLIAFIIFTTPHMCLAVGIQEDKEPGGMFEVEGTGAFQSLTSPDRP